MCQIVRLALTMSFIVKASIALAAGHTADSLDQVKANVAQKKAVLLDVREKREWADGHLAEARLFPLSELKKAASEPAGGQQIAEQLPKDKIIYCHCGSGVRVLAVAKILSDLGYDVRPLKDGYNDLIEAGFAPAAK
jgi:rhodanese-related sulfurtransferase